MMGFHPDKKVSLVNLRSLFREQQVSEGLNAPPYRSNFPLFEDVKSDFLGDDKLLRPNGSKSPVLFHNLGDAKSS